MMTTRRNVTIAAAAAASGVAAAQTASPQATPTETPTAHDASQAPANWHGQERIVMLIYPGFTALDMVGPHYMFTHLMGATTQVVARSREPVRSDTGLVITPDLSLSECDGDIDILCLPGGTTGTLDAMEDAATIDFLRQAEKRTRFITSVCTGSLILGAAGLLDGYRATSHWATRPLLPIFGATEVDARIVRDRNRITAAGVTAGLDFGLGLVGELRDTTYAQGVQLLAEYAPEPPYAAGTTHTAPSAVKAMLDGMFAGFIAKAETASRRSFARVRPG